MTSDKFIVDPTRELFETIDVLIVHDGPFHADDALCVAIARMINPYVEVIRTRNDRLIEAYRGRANTVICDVGLGVHDHHQKNATRREDGSKYAASGLLFRDYGWMIMPSQRAYNKFVSEIIRPIEQTDNYGPMTGLYQVVLNMNPAWDSDGNMSTCFERAVAFMSSILSGYIQNAKVELRAIEYVDNALRNGDGKLAILSEYGPWRDIIADTSAEYIVYPDAKGNWRILANKNMQTPPKTTFGTKAEAVKMAKKYLGGEKSED